MSHAHKPFESKEIEKLQLQINGIHAAGHFSQVFPFCNEFLFLESIKKTGEHRQIETTKTRAAFLIGESNFLTFLPELSCQADLLFLNDINISIKQHTRFMLDCFQSCATRAEFCEKYEKLCPLIGTKDLYKKERTGRSLLKDLKELPLEDKHFLFSDERYLACKEALKKLKIIESDVDMSSSENCAALAEILKKHNITISLVNLTNLHHYIAFEKLLKNPIFQLIDHKESIVLFSVGYGSFTDLKSLQAKFSVGTQQYFELLVDKNPILPYESKLDDAVVHQINLKIKNIMKQLKMDEKCIPEIVNEVKKDMFGKLIGFQFAIKPPKLGSEIGKYSREAFLFVAKEMMNYYRSKWYYSDDDLLKMKAVIVDPGRAILFLRQDEPTLVNKFKAYIETVTHPTLSPDSDTRSFRSGP